MAQALHSKACHVEPLMTNSNQGAKRLVVPHPRHGAPAHERASQSYIAQRLADLLRAEYFAGQPPEPGPTVYYVPSETLVGQAAAQALGIQGVDDLFGGVVPRAFVGTKAITHGLLDKQARSPEGWSHALIESLAGAVLRGYTVFSRDDAQRAALLLLERGPIRLKPVHGIAGRGQVQIASKQELDEAIRTLTDEDCRDGLVIEENLRDVVTYSVGIVQVAGQTITYVGTQSLTHDNDGEEVYGGSELRVVPGGFDTLLALDLDETQRRAVDLARRYDAAALKCYPGIIASRRNYDIAEGKDAQGQSRVGVLEQSWRSGGASVAELAALQAFQADPGLKWVVAATQERYGKDVPPAPEGFGIVFEGEDDIVGLIRKSGGILQHGNA